MIYSFYFVEVQNFFWETVAKIKVYSFEEAFWQIEQFREAMPGAFRFIVQCPVNEWIEEEERRNG